MADTNQNPNNNANIPNNGSSIDRKTTGWLAYITWVGFLIAFLIGDKENAKFHINQALVINIFSTIASVITSIDLWFFKIVGGLLSLFTFICWILGLVAAINDEEKEVPLIGQIKILK